MRILNIFFSTMTNKIFQIRTIIDNITDEMMGDENVGNCAYLRVSSNLGDSAYIKKKKLNNKYILTYE